MRFGNKNNPTILVMICDVTSTLTVADKAFLKQQPLQLSKPNAGRIRLDLLNSFIPLGHFCSDSSHPPGLPLLQKRHYFHPPLECHCVRLEQALSFAAV